VSKDIIITNRNRQYTLGEELARGTFGVIRECVDKLGNRCVAKILLKNKRSYKTLKWRWIVEVNNMKLLRHPNILYLYDAFEYDRSFYMIIEYCDMTLEKYLKERTVKNGDSFLRKFAPGILRAVDFIHTQKYVHKDIHAGNIYIKNLNRGIVEDNIRLGDFGISVSSDSYDREKTILLKHIKPPEFIAPKYFGVLDERSDIYQLGLLFLSIVRGKDKNYTQQEIVDGIPKDDLLQIETVYKDVISKMLIRHSAKRVKSIVDIYEDMML